MGWWTRTRGLIPLPTARSTAIPWLALTALYVVIFGIREPGALWGLNAISSAKAGTAVRDGAALTIFGSLLFWLQLRTVFLTSRIQLKPFLFWTAFFVIGYPTLCGFIMLFRGEAVLVDPRVATIDVDLVAGCFAAGQFAFVSGVVMSLIWKTDEPGYGTIRLARQTALSLLNAVRQKNYQLSRTEWDRLKAALADIAKTALPAAARAFTDSESRLLQKWASAASELDHRFQSLDVADVASELESFHALIDDLERQMEHE